MEHISGVSKISLGKVWKNAFSLSTEKVAALIELEPGEEIIDLSFCRIVKNFVFHIESNLFVTNKRIVFQEGTKLTTLWKEDIVSVQMHQATFWEVVYMMQKYSYVTVTYHAKESDQTIKFWCSNGIIGAAPIPMNDTTGKIYNHLLQLAPSAAQN